MIDAAMLVGPPAAAGAQPTEGATPEGFGDVLSAMLAGGAGAQGPKADAADTEAAQAATVTAELVAALREAAGRAPKGVSAQGRGRPSAEQRLDVGEPAEVAAEADPTLEADADPALEAEAPRETAGKVASSAWHASTQALAHVPAWAAPAVSVPRPAESSTHETGDAQTAEISADAPVEVVVPDVPAAVEAAPEPTPTAVERAATHGAETAGEHTPTQAVRPQAAERRAERADVRVGDPVAVGGGDTGPAPVDARSQVSAPVELIGAGVLQRVLDAIEQAQHRPPPNTMAVDVPAEGGDEAMRLVVTVRGETVQVSGGPGEQGLPPGWARPLADALAERGMSLEGFGTRQRGHGRDDQPRPDERDRGRAPRPTVPTDDGALRL